MGLEQRRGAGDEAVLGRLVTTCVSVFFIVTYLVLGIYFFINLCKTMLLYFIKTKNLMQDSKS